MRFGLSPAALACYGLLTAAACREGTARDSSHSSQVTAPRSVSMSSSDNPTPKPTAHKSLTGSAKGAPPESVIAAARAKQSSPSFQALVARATRLAQRGTPALVFVDHPLPNGELAHIRLGQPGALRRFIVVSLSGFSDEVFDRAMLLSAKLERTHLDDESPMSATLYRDGRYTAESQQSGKWSGKHAPRFFGKKHDETMSSEMLQDVATAKREDVPGFGRGRVLRNGVDHDSP